MSRFVKMALLNGVPYGIAMGLFFWMQKQNPVGMVLGLVSGMVFGVVMAGFFTYFRARAERNTPDLPGESVLKRGIATLRRGWEGVGGYFYLTDQRVLFRPHQFNVQSQDCTIALADIVAIELSVTLVFVPNALRIQTKSDSFLFVVEERQAWMDAINQAR